MPTVTAQTIITAAWVSLGIGSPGATMPAPEASWGLDTLNRFNDSMSGVDDMINVVTLARYALSANVAVYNIGTGATFNTLLPVMIETASIVLAVPGGDEQTFPLDIIPEEQWAAIGDKKAAGTVPTKMFFSPVDPVGTLNFHPIPKAAVTTQVELGVWSPIPQLATLATTVNLPATYYRYEVLGLAIELAPTYGSVVNPVILQTRQQQYAEARAIVQARNRELRMKQAPSPTPEQVARARAQQPQAGA